MPRQLMESYAIPSVSAHTSQTPSRHAFCGLIASKCRRTGVVVSFSADSFTTRDPTRVVDAPSNSTCVVGLRKHSLCQGAIGHKRLCHGVDPSYCYQTFRGMAATTIPPQRGKVGHSVSYAYMYGDAGAKENMSLGISRRPSTQRQAPGIPRSAGFDSLQDLLEREGYKDTRIITPKIPKAISIDDADDMGLVSDEPTRHKARPMHGSYLPKKPDDIEPWMHQVTASAQGPPPPRLRTSRSDHTLKKRPRRRQSTIWDASVAYLHSAGQEVPSVPPPVPPIPPQYKSRPGVAGGPPGESAPGFASSPAAPVLSREDAVVHVYETDSTVLPRGLRRSKSEDLLHKTLKSRRTQRLDAPLECTCGHTRSKVPIEPRWHLQLCPIRVQWEATMTEPIPPPPPRLTVSTPRGISTPKHLELNGAEFDPVDTPNTLSRYMPFSRPGFALAKRATLEGLHGFFKGQEKGSDVPSSRHPSKPRSSPQPRCVPAPRLSHATSLPQLSKTPKRLPDVPAIRIEASPALTGSQRVHELHQHFQNRIKQDDSTELPATPKLDGLLVSDESNHASLMESPTLQRARSRSRLTGAGRLPDLAASHEIPPSRPPLDDTVNLCHDAMPRPPTTDTLLAPPTRKLRRSTRSRPDLVRHTAAPRVLSQASLSDRRPMRPISPHNNVFMTI